MYICQTKGRFSQTLLEVQTNEHVYMALRVVKQATSEKMEVYYECILKLANYLHHKIDNNLFMTFFPSQIGTLFAGNHYKDETR
jgi:methenyltetrahydromethanopterin cyclohydrolase